MRHVATAWISLAMVVACQLALGDTISSEPPEHTEERQNGYGREAAVSRDGSIPVAATSVFYGLSYDSVSEQLRERIFPVQITATASCLESMGIPTNGKLMTISLCARKPMRGYHCFDAPFSDQTESTLMRHSSDDHQVNHETVEDFAVVNSTIGVSMPENKYWLIVTEPFYSIRRSVAASHHPIHFVRVGPFYRDAPILDVRMKEYNNAVLELDVVSREVRGYYRVQLVNVAHKIISQEWVVATSRSVSIRVPHDGLYYVQVVQYKNWFLKILRYGYVVFRTVPFSIGQNIDPSLWQIDDRTLFLKGGIRVVPISALIPRPVTSHRIDHAHSTDSLVSLVDDANLTEQQQPPLSPPPPQQEQQQQQPPPPPRNPITTMFGIAGAFAGTVQGLVGAVVASRP